MREPLKKGRAIKLQNESKLSEVFTIEGTCGMGATCIVYDAKNERKEKVKIKEFFPILSACGRNEFGKIEVDYSSNSYKRAKERFLNGYKLQVELRKNESLTNSIIPISGIYYGYGTIYIVSTDMRGTTLENAPATSLSSLLTIMISISKVINSYHKAGYLTLDIKPSNVLRIPETDEHIMMYDFDSLVRIDDLKKGNIYSISFSNNWAAPELKSAVWSKICEATDIYSIGSIVFFFIFGRHDGVEDRESSSKWDFNKINSGMLDGIDNRIFKELTEFFHKTLASSVKRRYRKVEELINALEELKTISDEKQYVCSNILHANDIFFGRESLLDELKDSLAEKEKVALVGIDGIGKAEAVKQYVKQNEDRYRKIIMVYFDESIINTINSEDIKIHNYNRLEELSDEEFFCEKIQLLKNLLCSRDLLIIYNYTKQDEEHLNEILSMPCKIIFTTTNNMKKYGIPCIEVSYLNPIECLDLFKVYNKMAYNKENMNAINGILNNIGYHTMAIILFAQYLQYSGVLPTELLEKMQGNLNVFDSINVNGLSNGRFCEGTVVEHLQRLFNMLELSEDEKEIMLSLSLMKNFKISCKMFRKLFNWKNSSNGLLGLVDKGWIILDECYGKIFLHPLVQQVVHLNKPDTNNCSRFIREFISEYECKKTYYETCLWNRALEHIYKNISGDDCLYGDLCIHEGTRDSLIKAKKIFSKLDSEKYLKTSLKLLKNDLIEVINNLGPDSWKDRKGGYVTADECVSQIISLIKAEIINNELLSSPYLKVNHTIKICNIICFDVLSGISYLTWLKPEKSICKGLAVFIRRLLETARLEVIEGDFSEESTDTMLSEINKFFNENGESDFIDNYLSRITDDNEDDALDFYYDDLCIREDVKKRMYEDDVDDDALYFYYCALVDSEKVMQDEKNAIWKNAFDKYYYGMRFIHTGAKEYALECLEHIPPEVIYEMYYDDFCRIAIDFKEYDACKSCYDYVIKHRLSDNKDTPENMFEEWKLVAEYANDSKHEEDAICCWILAILKLIGPYDCEKNSNDILNLKRLEIQLEDALQNHVCNEYVENIRELFAENICKYKDQYKKSYNLIRDFLEREVYRDLEIIDKHLTKCK